MEAFIPLLAKNLYERYGDEISSLYIIFPSRRARLFFTDALSTIAPKPMWAPQFRSLDEVMQDYSSLKVAEKIPLVTDLYKVYSGYHRESFDSFYYWGEMLLSDFDSIDKYMIDAGMLFRNVADLKEMEGDSSYLTPEQKEIILRFWNSFGHSGESDEKKKFLDIWSTLDNIYTDFRSLCTRKGSGYGGMVYRDAAQNIKAGRFDKEGISWDRKYIVAGFNALSECEKVLFRHLQTAFDAEFYWDYDRYYVDNRAQEAGLFLRENLSKFPQKYHLGESDNFAGDKNITVVSSPSDSLQCKYAGRILEQMCREGEIPGKETAIVLTDENLLVPMLSSIPESIRDINVTMGYPLKLTPAYTLFERLVEMQTRKRKKGERSLFRFSDITGLLAHPYIVDIDPETTSKILSALRKRQLMYPDISTYTQVDNALGCLFRDAGDGWETLSEYILAGLSAVISCGALGGSDRGQDRDNLALIAENIRRISNSLMNSELEMSPKIFVSLARKVLQNVRIPFEGEPLKGLQVMGILETRNLDFENVILVSANDDNFPGNRVNSYSFIPYNLRHAYGLPTPSHHEGVYAYYFYRLLQRARNVHIVYSSKSDEKSSGEQSRYIYQLEYESPHDLHRVGIGLDVNVPAAECISVEKSGDTAAGLKCYLLGEKQLSPTSFYNYVSCPLKFYFYSIAGIYKEEEPGEQVDAPMFGTILHRAMELLYTPLCGSDDPRADIAKLMGGQQVNDAVDKAVRDEFLRGEEVPRDEYGGNLLLVADIICRYINKCILPYDASGQPFRILRTEEELDGVFDFSVQGAPASVRFRGTADRVDMLPDGKVRVVDYKTGKEALSFNGLDSLFSPLLKDRNAAALQTLLYGMMISRREKRDAQPVLYYVRSLNSEGYSPLLENKQTKEAVTSYKAYGAGFEALVAEKLAELFNPALPFYQCEDVKTCVYCDFYMICKR